MTEAKGKLGVLRRLPSDGLVDLPRLRRERPEILKDYAQPGSDHFWSCRTLTAEERA